MSPQDINAMNKFGQTALHLSIDWPLGIRILIDAGADTECIDQENMLPLQYAIERLLVDPIRILGEANCSLRQRGQISAYEEVRKRSIIEQLDHQWGFLELSELCYKEPERVVLVLDTFLDLIVNRRMRLYDLVRQTFPLSEIARWFSHSNDGTHVIDETASRLAFELESRGIHVPPHLHPGKDQITSYHYFAGYPKFAERLWNAGFRDVNGRDSLGRTPLMLSPKNAGQRKWLEFVTWILSKGADLYAR